jgi:hypothetical protein
LLLAAAGCGGKGNVSGTVRYNGEPLPSGEIAFIGQSGDKQVKKGLIRDGAYRIDAIPCGPVKITVTTSRPTGSSTGAAPTRGVKPGELPPVMQGMQVKLPEPGQTPEPPAKYVPIPERYADPERSGLEYTVTRGSNTKDVDLLP